MESHSLIALLSILCLVFNPVGPFFQMGKDKYTVKINIRRGAIYHPAEASKTAFHIPLASKQKRENDF